ncbi:MAG: universal stress protein [Verrucomicrobia bacterium]|nr:universal stress protein [Verrucomicrobiota bacterium]
MKTSKKAKNTQREITAPTVRPKIQEILATTDFSGQSLPAVRYALALGGKIGASVTLLHVVELPSSLSGMESVVLTRTDAEIAALAQTRLEALAQRESRSDRKVTTVIRTGKPFHEIALAAGERMADLIIIATHGYTGAKRVLLGSTAERVVRHAPGPVLTVPTRTTPRRTGQTPPLTLKKILVPIDFSDLSKAALPWATFMAAPFNAELILLHVVEEFPIDYLVGRELMSHTIIPLIKQAEADLNRLAGSLRKKTGLNISAVVRDGKPFEEICHAAKALAADLVVLTTHGYTGLKHVWLGSTAERVVRHAHCPVLAVREPNRKTL